MTRRYRDYDPFAWLYTQYWGDEFHKQALPVLDRLVLARIPKKGRILDLCCGDGRITAHLAKRGYNLLGIDGSERMLTYAKHRSPKVEFLLKDARSFELPPEFDAVISTFDSLNHVMEVRGLEAVFRNVYACLKPGGIFVFDLNREEAYRDYWARTSTSVDPRAVSIARGTYDGLDKIADCDVTLFRLESGGWQRSDFRLSQRFHPEDVVTGALRNAGFTVEVLDGAKDLAMQGDIGQGRNFFAGYKSTS
jgi:SAM-dependent methyltransferase